MSKPIRRVILGVIALALLALLAWSYSYVSPMTPRASEEWSRGRVVGRTGLNRPVALQPAPGGGVFLVWPNVDGRLELARLAADGETTLQEPLAVGDGSSSAAQMELGEDGRLHLLWREGGEPHATVRYALVEPDGTPATEAQVLSDPSHWVVDPPRLVSGAGGQVHALWADEIGVQWAVLNAEGALLEGPRLLVPEGRAPDAQLDREGQLHLVWRVLSGSNYIVRYATFDPESGELSSSEDMAQIFRRTGQRIEGPVIGLDHDTGYVFWSMHDRRDATVVSEYAFFLLELPRQKRVVILRMEHGVNPSGVFPLRGQRTLLLVALSELVGPDWEAEYQIAVAILGPQAMPEYEVWGLASGSGGRRGFLSLAGIRVQEGVQGMQGPPAQEWEMEQIVTASTLASTRPVLAIDERSYLHLAWLEPGGFDQYRVVYASSAPEVEENFGALMLWDVVDPVFRHVFRLTLVFWAAGPLLVLWGLIPMGVLLVYHLVTGEEMLETTGSRLVLGLVVGLEVVLSMLFPPRGLLSVPFVRWTVPAVTAVVALLVTTAVVRRDRESSLFVAFFTFTAIHTLAQLVGYYVF